ncbi:putative receptor protein kinase ZmPK1 [Bidens hawaiensis]|uniref:putative receptor protein kinase ZmPK1 n=1 Tax=Bidens hawaiensis TaxID=980011 RepID=UPI00404A18E4
MTLSFLLSLIVLIFTYQTPLIISSSSFSSPPFALKLGLSLTVEKKDDFLISQNRLYTAGFYSVGVNAYCFSIWLTKPLSDGSQTIVWMANRDLPVNGKFSKLSLLKTGNLILRDAYQRVPIWSTSTRDTTQTALLRLNNSGNLFLLNRDGKVLWQSFDSPTDTLLPNQPLTKLVSLVSSRSSTNHSSGFFKLFFDNDNVVRLVYSDSKLTGIYWPDPEFRAWESGRNIYGSRRIATMDSSGHFISTDDLLFNTSDAGDEPLLRRLTMDFDGNFRAYSLDESRGIWQVTWQAMSEGCKIHGSCGENSTCSNDPIYGRKCSCIPNHRMINHTDWSYGCEPEFKPASCGNSEYNFLHLPHSDFWGYDSRYMPNTTLSTCKKECLKSCSCKGFQFKYDWSKGFTICYPKFLLVNGLRSTNFNGSMYLKVPKSVPLSLNNSRDVQGFNLNCSGKPTIQLDRVYDINRQKDAIKFLMLTAYVFGALELICISSFFYGTRSRSITREQGYYQAATGFKQFRYAELKKASKNFKEEIGRGGGGIVYKGVLSDNRVVAIKRLNYESSNRRGEAELLAEISTLGRLNHMNLIEIYGYCAESKHRLLVYEYMENGSLSQNLQSNKLDWDKRLDIALDTAKGLAYLHEECLEWILHCDVKPQNILLDRDYKPKVADFGLSKLLDRNDTRDLEFTRACGTRGYMAPEWLFVNLPITSKVDVFSYGVVILEMITGRRPTGANQSGGSSEGRLDSWVREKIAAAGGKNDWIQEVVDSTVDGNYNMSTMGTLIKVALRCCEEYKDARPTMSQVVDMLLHVEKDD